MITAPRWQPLTISRNQRGRRPWPRLESRNAAAAAGFWSLSVPTRQVPRYCRAATADTGPA